MDIIESLQPLKMLQLYASGAFPMAELDGELNWYFPQIRTIIPLSEFNIPRSLKKFMKSALFEYRLNYETMTVVKQCSNREETWISNDLIEAYERLEQLGFLQSVSVFQKNELVGGLYGVSYRGAFFGESMFSKVSESSKCALVKLVENLNKMGYVLLDVQFQNHHLEMFGAIEIQLAQYNELLLKAYQIDTKFSDSNTLFIKNEPHSPSK